MIWGKNPPFKETPISSWKINHFDDFFLRDGGFSPWIVFSPSAAVNSWTPRTQGCPVHCREKALPKCWVLVSDFETCHEVAGSYQQVAKQNTRPKSAQGQFMPPKRRQEPNARKKAVLKQRIEELKQQLATASGLQVWTECGDC